MPHSAQAVSQLLLFAERDPKLVADLKTILKEAAYWVQHCPSYVEGVEWVCRNRNHQPDAIIIDVPDERSKESMNAFRFYGFVRSGGWAATVQQRFEGWGEEVPVFMLIDAANRLSIEERMYALGVTPERIDYKPYHSQIFLHKLNSLLRHERTDTPANDSSILRVRSLMLDPDTETVTVQGERLSLSHLEYQLLHYFMSHPDTVLSRDELLADIWGITGAKAVNNRNVDVYVGRLRKKLAGTDCSDLIGRGRNGAYVLETASYIEYVTEPEGATRAQRTRDATTVAIALIRESNATHLPGQFMLEATSTDSRFQAGIKIGRNGGICDWVLPDKRISRWHATLFRDRGTFYARDENSSGHTYIIREAADGQTTRRRLEPREHIQIDDGDVIYFNTIAYRIQING